jgi:hypothetical protein
VKERLMTESAHLDYPCSHCVILSHYTWRRRKVYWCHMQHTYKVFNPKPMRKTPPKSRKFP